MTTGYMLWSLFNAHDWSKFNAARQAPTFAAGWAVGGGLVED